MKFPTVNSCCCCINLRVAGYILGVLIILSALSSLGARQYYTGGLYVILGVAWLFGVIKDKSGYLLPTIILGFLTLIFIYLMPVFVILVINLFPDLEKVQEFKKNFPNFKYEMIGGYILSVVIGTYLWIVEYSVYRHVKEASKGRYSQPRSDV